MMKWAERERTIDDVVTRFPSEFGLRNFPKERFTINRSACYWSDINGPMLYVYVVKPEGNVAFSKGTEQELLRQIVRD